MSKIVQQIQIRFKWFQIILICEILYSILSLILNQLFKSDILENLSTQVFAIFGILDLVTSSILTVLFYTSFGMLTHGIFNYLKINRNSEVDPNWSVWSIFIPFANEILISLNAKKGYKTLNLDTSIPSQYFRYAIFSLVTSFFLLITIFYHTILTLGRTSSDSILQKPFGTSFSTAVCLSILIFISYYFQWKIMKEMKNAIVVNSLQVDVESKAE